MREHAGGVGQVDDSRIEAGAAQGPDRGGQSAGLRRGRRGLRLLRRRQLREGARQNETRSLEGSGECAGLLGPDSQAPHARVELDVHPKRSGERRRGAREAGSVLEVVESGRQPVGLQQRGLFRIGKVQQQDLSRDPRAPQRDGLFEDRDREHRCPLGTEAPRYGCRAVPVGVRLDDGDDRHSFAHAPLQAPVVARDRPEVDDRPRRAREQSRVESQESRTSWGHAIRRSSLRLQRFVQGANSPQKGSSAEGGASRA